MCLRCVTDCFSKNRGGTAIPDAITIAFTPEYAPLLDIMDEACDACRISRAGLVRSLLCDTFEFTPEKPRKTYNSHRKRAKQ